MTRVQGDGVGLVTVAHIADHSAATTSLVHFLRWAARSGRAGQVGLGAVCWQTGPAAPELHAAVPTIDVGRVLDDPFAGRLEGAGLAKLGGGLRGRRVRHVLAPLGAARVVYLNTGFAGWCLRYLPRGEHEVVTHLHELDRERAGDLLPDDRSRLVAATDRWLATSEELADWAAGAFDVAAHRIVVQPPVIDPTGEPTDDRARRRRRLGLAERAVLVGIIGAPSWRRGPDHAGRLVAAFRRQRPELDVRLLWCDLVDDDRELWPLEGDARRADGAILHRPRSGERPLGDLDLVDVVVMTAADHRSCFAAWMAAAHAKPLVCFDTHRMAHVAAEGGVVVPYPDAEGAAAAVAQLVDRPDELRRLGERARKVSAEERGGDTAGSRLLAAALSGSTAPVSSPSGPAGNG